MRDRLRDLALAVVFIAALVIPGALIDQGPREIETPPPPPPPSTTMTTTADIIDAVSVVWYPRQLVCQEDEIAVPVDHRTLGGIEDPRGVTRRCKNIDEYIGTEEENEWHND